MLWLAKKLAGLLTGELLGPVTDLFKAFINKEITEKELQVKLIALLAPVYTAQITASKDVILAEIGSEDWLVRRWRPITVMCLAFIPFFYGLIVPVAVDWFGLPSPRVGDPLLIEILEIVKIAIGGYIGGRSLEKIATTVSSALRK